MFSRSLCFAMLAMVLTGCAADDSSPSNTDDDTGRAAPAVPTCTPGRIASCLCGMVFGFQTCQADGTFGACSCEPPDDGGDGDGAAGNDDTGGDGDGQVAPVNACGGRTVLDVTPGEVCGACNDGFHVCDGRETTTCAYASDLNACDSCANLRGRLPGDPCGPCGDGTLQCDGNGGLVCTGDSEANACGGCEVLPQAPGFVCNTGSVSDGVWRCTGPDAVRCVGPGANACGGEQPLSGTPATACGVCDDGRRFCASLEELVCLDPDPQRNACGGCGTLPAAPDSPCGACGGVWTCDGSDAVTCSEVQNPCGGCLPLADAPGEPCSSSGVVVCDGPVSTVCDSSGTRNTCGGTNQLAHAPGAPCGECGDGAYVCVGNAATACVGDVQQRNACGGCGPLANGKRVGEACGPGGAIWQCDGERALLCATPAELGDRNACGGAVTLDGVPGQPCGECGTYACDAGNPDVLLCRGDSEDTQRDERNCGACGRRCLPDQVCDAGACKSDVVVQMDVSREFTVLRTAGGAVWGWGYNEATGPVGNGSTTNFELEPVRANITDVVEVAVGNADTPNIGAQRAGTVCAVRAGGAVWCWGDNSDGQLGFDPNVARGSSTPIEVSGVSDVIDLEISEGTVCAITASRDLWCWGNNAFGKRGTGSLQSTLAPNQVTGLSDVEELAMGHDTLCARDTDRDVYCWGSDDLGGLGDGVSNTDAAYLPQPVPGLPPVVRIDARPRSFVALTADGEVYQWGRAVDGVSGYEVTYTEPTVLEQSGGSTQVYASFQNIFAATPSGLRMWGTDDGTSGTTDSTRAVGRLLGPIPSAASIVDIGGVQQGTIVLLERGGLFVSGEGAYLGDGQLRNGAMRIDTRAFHPVPFFAPLSSELGNCFDGLDNDGDGATDCVDSDCAEDVGSATGDGAITGTYDFEWYNYRALSCHPGFVREKFYRWTAPSSGTYTVDSGDTARWARIEVVEACRTSAVSLACAEDDFSGGVTTATFEATAGEDYIFIVELDVAGGVAVSLDITEVP